MWRDFRGMEEYFEYPGIWPMIRKVASDFGWDWGPAFVPVGIYKPAYLVTLSSSIGASVLQTGTPPISPSAASKDDISGPIFVEESSIDIYKKGQNFSTPADQTANWIVNVTLGLRSAAAIPRSSLTLSFPELRLISEPFDISDIPVSTNDTVWITAIWEIPDHIPQRWYPHNLGIPKLYDLNVVLSAPSSGNAPATSVINFVTRTGFRTIELAQTRYSQKDIDQRGIWPGDQWHFKINGKAFYASGTNVIPFDPFYARTSSDQVRWVLESAVKSGQNMIRVWGGGTYQPSSASVAGGVYDFYSICDELGLMAWSELIFSDALYPINDFLLKNIEPEVRQNVRRINRHPSVAQWAGGNEIEGIAIWTDQWVENGIHYLNEYVTLFQDFLHDIVTSETHSLPYTDCSTTKGVLSLDPYVLRFNNGTQGEIYGNSEFELISERFNYDASVAFDYTTYPVARFVNEFGFHSMPSFYTWQEVLQSPDDFFFNSTVVMSREHHPPAGSLAFPNPNAAQGQGEMSIAVELWLPTPNTPDSNQTFAQWCWSTQIFQAMTIVSEVSWYRHGAGQSENNLGALIWQLNDIWQAPSWSSIEYSGRWKVLQYGLTSAYAPITIYPFWTVSNETLEVLVISDRWEDVEASAQATWYDWKGRPLNTTFFDFTIPALNNSLLYEAKGLNNILPIGRDASDVWLHINVSAVVDGRRLTNEQYFTPTSLANAHLVDPKISVTRDEDLTFTLSAKGGVGAWTWIDHPSGTVGIFVDKETGLPSNGYYLIPGIDRTAARSQTEGYEEKDALGVEDPGMDALRGSFGTVGSIIRARSARRMSQSSNRTVNHRIRTVHPSAPYDRDSALRPWSHMSNTPALHLDEHPSGLKRHQLYDAPVPSGDVSSIPGSPLAGKRPTIKFDSQDLVHQYDRPGTGDAHVTEHRKAIGTPTTTGYPPLPSIPYTGTEGLPPPPASTSDLLGREEDLSVFDERRSSSIAASAGSSMKGTSSTSSSPGKTGSAVRQTQTVTLPMSRFAHEHEVKSAPPTMNQAGLLPRKDSRDLFSEDHSPSAGTLLSFPSVTDSARSEDWDARRSSTPKGSERGRSSKRYPKGAGDDDREESRAGLARYDL
ncbi:hypothetical protein H0H93_001475 [Arthromyces matolae]|nr:hypothetical protein H0H93_001475 [Arthromyces matolae]